jgi:hypothetical protein
VAISAAGMQRKQEVKISVLTRWWLANGQGDLDRPAVMPLPVSVVSSVGGWLDAGYGSQVRPVENPTPHLVCSFLGWTCLSQLFTSD